MSYVPERFEEVKPNADAFVEEEAKVWSPTIAPAERRCLEGDLAKQRKASKERDSATLKWVRDNLAGSHRWVIFN